MNGSSLGAAHHGACASSEAVMRVLQRIWNWLDRRNGFSATVLPVLTHPVPRKVNW